MAAATTIHVCSDCAHTEARWHGQCPGCGEWNTLVEEAAPPRISRGKAIGGAGAQRAAGRRPSLRCATSSSSAASAC